MIFIESIRTISRGKLLYKIFFKYTTISKRVGDKIEPMKKWGLVPSITSISYAYVCTFETKDSCFDACAYSWVRVRRQHINSYEGQCKQSIYNTSAKSAYRNNKRDLFTTVIIMLVDRSFISLDISERTNIKQPKTDNNDNEGSLA